MKKEIQLACTIKQIFVGKSDNLEEKKTIKKKWQSNKGIYINTLSQNIFEVKRIIRLILKLLSWLKRYRAPVKLIPKQTSKLNVRQQENMQKAAIGHQKMMLNIMLFEATGLTYLDSLISELNKNTPR